MIALGLLTCVILRAFSAHAKVVTSFNECNEFFYKGIEPRGMDQNAKRICQMYTDGQSIHPAYYATLYSVHHRIPLYSAYMLDPAFSSTPGKYCKDNWHLEPQISQPNSPTDHMVRENQNNQNIFKNNQAISPDYRYTGYDRGHLNPNSFQSDTGRTATCTLTNAAPMDACFNRIHWSKWESSLKSLLKLSLARDGAAATAYIVTGTVPSTNERIPQRGTSEDPERVTVPSHIWTAVCYKHNTDDTESFSFSYMGRNQPEEPGIDLMTVSNLNDRLGELYSLLSSTPPIITIFADVCGEDNNKLKTIQQHFQKLINLPLNQGVQMSPDVQNTLGAVKRVSRSDSMSSKSNVKVRKMTANLAFDRMDDYYTVEDDLKPFSDSACLLTHVKPQVFNDELRKSEVSEDSDAVECLLVSDKPKTAADGSPCSSISECSYSCQCTTGGKIKPCCSSPCLYHDNLKGYRCYSGQTQVPCSPPYSLVTYKGDRCKDDHPCATYGHDYFWCNTISGGWDYCSPPLRHSKARNGKYCSSNQACAKYDKKYKWCYTDDKSNWDYCSSSDDCHSAKNGKTCRSDHPCGHHGKNYLWCYTDDQDNWDYCCKDCGH
ncbi:uncharacterized protein [Garra rufa]|uniref:uncharacterized protein n=1 Tax=Garra rufa TaxID=137080 RepID=UPI003CCE9D8F